MTMPHERTRALIQTEKFLRELSRSENQSEEVRQEARRLLRHYPSQDDLNIVVDVWNGPDPMRSLIECPFSKGTSFEPT